MASSGKVSGEDLLRKSYIQQHKPWQSYRLVGPFEDAKPESKIVVVNVPRVCDDGSWSTYMNANNSLVALNTLEQAGHKNPTIALPKAHSTASSTNVAIGQHGSRKIIAYDDLTFHNGVPNGATMNGADALGHQLHGTKTHDFGDGSGMVLEDYNRVDLASQVNRIALKGLSLWGAPTEAGMVANLGPMAGDFLKGMQDQSLMEELKGSGESQLMSQILSQSNAAQGKWSSDTAGIDDRMRASAAGGVTHVPRPTGAGGRQTRF